MRVAIVHEWFNEIAGSEKCVREFCKIYPDADVFALVDWLSDSDREQLLLGKKVNTSFIQSLPLSRKHFRQYLPLFPIAVEQFDLTAYDLVLSSSHLVAKGVLTHPEQVHICYCHTPVRYAWDLYHQYLQDHGLDNKGIKSLFVRYFLHRLRMWDVLSSQRVDHFIANSNYVKERIAKTYRRDAQVIYPPVDVERFQLEVNKEGYYLTASRLVPYKRIDLIVQAFAGTKHKLLVAGDGPEMSRLKKMATGNIEFLGYQSDDNLVKLMQKAKAFVFAALEDFGIMPVEAQACGTPVICLGKGGTAETVIHGETGVHFREQTVVAIREAIELFEKQQDRFDPVVIKKNINKFNSTLFRQGIEQQILFNIS